MCLLAATLWAAFNHLVDVEAAPARTYDEIDATRTMIDRTEARFDLKPRRLIADTAYGIGCDPGIGLLA